MEGQAPDEQLIDIWYTTDGADPVDEGDPVDGKDRPHLRPDTRAIRLHLTQVSETTVKARVLESGHWSDVTSAVLSAYALCARHRSGPQRHQVRLWGRQITVTNLADGHTLRAKVSSDSIGTRELGVTAVGGERVHIGR
jgi:hypothetical protein